MKVIKIDVEKQMVYHVETEGTLQDWYDLIGCTSIEAPVRYSYGDALFCDEEGWLGFDKNKPTPGFMIGEWRYAIVGNGLIIGSDDEGESVSAKMDIEFIENNIKWRSGNYMKEQGIAMGLIK